MDDKGLKKTTEETMWSDLFKQNSNGESSNGALRGDVLACLTGWRKALYLLGL